MHLKILLCPSERDIIPVLRGLKILIEVAMDLDKDYFIISYLKVVKVVIIFPW